MLVDLLSGESWVLEGDLFGEAVVLADEEGVHRGQSGLFVGADVACEEEARVVIGWRVVERVGVEWEEVACGGRELTGAVVGAEFGFACGVVAVDVGAVDP